MAERKTIESTFADAPLTGGKIEGLLTKLREKTARIRSGGVQKADSTQ